MELIFANDDLDRLEVDATFTANYAYAILEAYRSRINTIRQAPDERVFYALKALHFEKLKGKRKHQHSMRLNDQYRLIIELVGRHPAGKAVRIVEITDYH